MIASIPMHVISARVVSMAMLSATSTVTCAPLLHDASCWMCCHLCAHTSNACRHTLQAKHAKHAEVSHRALSEPSAPGSDHDPLNRMSDNTCRTKLSPDAPPMPQ